MTDNNNRIVSARITPLPKKLGDPLPEVWATFGDGTEKMLFSYYPDEIEFTVHQFRGLTEDQARKLKFIRDKDYLSKEGSIHDSDS